MARFSIGDWVRIKSNARNIKPSHELAFAPGMYCFEGQTYRIKSKWSSHHEFYTLEGVFDKDDGYVWVWDADWLELVDSEEFVDTALQIEIKEDDVMGVFNSD